MEASFYDDDWMQMMGREGGKPARIMSRRVDGWMGLCLLIRVYLDDTQWLDTQWLWMGLLAIWNARRLVYK